MEEEEAWWRSQGTEEVRVSPERPGRIWRRRSRKDACGKWSRARRREREFGGGDVAVTAECGGGDWGEKVNAIKHGSGGGIKTVTSKQRLGVST